jgi:hypothetical protein
MKTIEQVLAKAEHNVLLDVIAKTQELQHLHNLFCRFISPDLIAHCHLAKLEDNKLHVVVDSAVWGARLRYAIPDILKNLKLQPEFKKVEKIQYHIDVETIAPTSKFSKNKLSDANEQLWRQAIADLKDKKK